jgi:uncharacterized membrane protein YgcG
MHPQYTSLLELILALALLAFLVVVSFEVWLVRLALVIISRTPILREIVPVEARRETRHGPRFQLVRERSWWQWERGDVRRVRGGNGGGGGGGGSSSG